MKAIPGCITTIPADALKVAEALREGPVAFSWTDGATQYEFYMVPVRCFKTRFEAPQKIQRWLSYDHVIVSIERKGCFHFDLLSGTQQYMADYVAEKLSLDRFSGDGVGLATLFNMIIASGQKFGRNIVL